MNCSELKNILPLHSSGELPSGTRTECEDHLKTCAACAQIVAGERQLDDLMRGAFAAQSLELSPLRTRVRAKIAAAKNPGLLIRWRAPGANPLRWLSLAAACLALLSVGAIYVTSQRSETRLYAAAITDHIDDAVKKVEKQGWRTSPEEIKAFALEQFGTDAFLANLAPADFRLNRVRMCNLKGNRFAHFVFEAGGREVSFFVQSRAGELSGPRVEIAGGQPIFAHASEGYEVAGFQSGKLTVLIVTVFTRPENLRLAREAARRLS